MQHRSVARARGAAVRAAAARATAPVAAAVRAAAAMATAARVTAALLLTYLLTNTREGTQLSLLSSGYPIGRAALSIPSCVSR